MNQSRLTMYKKAVSLLLCWQVVTVYAVEPSCPNLTFGREILEHTIETNMIVKALQQDIAGVRDGLYKRSVSFNEWVQLYEIKQNLTVLYSKLERMELKVDLFERKFTKGKLLSSSLLLLLFLFLHDM